MELCFALKKIAMEKEVYGRGMIQETLKEVEELISYAVKVLDIIEECKF